MSLNKPKKPTNDNNYTVCIICNDERAKKWGSEFARIEKFSHVYIVQSDYDFQIISPGNTDGSLLSEDQLPSSFSGILFHSSNKDLWRSLNLTAEHIFEFNTPGDPREQGGILPIRRQTAPYFNIREQDIAEISDYITNKRTRLPLCCTKTVQPQVLPSLVCLFQLYLNHIKNNKTVPANFWRDIWGEPPNSDATSEDWRKWSYQLEREWQYDYWNLIGHSNADKAPINALLKTLFTDLSSVSSVLIDEAYAALKDKLGCINGQASLQANKPDSMQAIIIRSGDSASYILSSLLSSLWGVPRQSIELNEDDISQIPRQSLLILSESQINDLKQLRLWGFSGAVLVVSGESFNVLKKRHRVLRFGQSSHKSFPAPWNLETLLTDLTDVIPLAPENLEFLQQELGASAQLCQSHVEPCLKLLDQINKSGQAKMQDLSKLENAAIEIRAQLPVACHGNLTIKTANGEENLQIQEHFQDALKKLSSEATDQIRAGVEQFEQALSQLQFCVLEAW
ncbi:MAG: hypothetical protein AAGD25_16010 [Cyanobacteria bacterium P01_F01_bin.150]